jgi:hypothetical protein
MNFDITAAAQMSKDSRIHRFVVECLVYEMLAK